VGQSVGDWPPFVDAAEVRPQLHVRFVLGMLSNMDGASPARSLAADETEPDFTVTAERIGTARPNPSRFEAAAATLAAQANRQAD